MEDNYTPSSLGSNLETAESFNTAPPRPQYNAELQTRPVVDITRIEVTPAAQAPQQPKPQVKRLGIFRRRRPECNASCYLKRKTELLEQFGLTNNALAQRWVSRKRPMRHTCTSNITQVPGYKRLRVYLTARSLFNSEAREIKSALDKYELKIKKSV